MKDAILARFINDYKEVLSIAYVQPNICSYCKAKLKVSWREKFASPHSITGSKR